MAITDKSKKDFQAQLTPFDAGKALALEIDGRGHLENNSLHVIFTLTGPIDIISFDTVQTSPRRTDNLWQRTCFEVFIQSENSSKYWEYNLSPASNWAAYGFERYRQGKFDELSITRIPISTHFEGQSFKLESTIPLPETISERNLKIGLSCVVQDKNGVIYYYALKHTKPQADFHDEGSFIINLKP